MFGKEKGKNHVTTGIRWPAELASIAQRREVVIVSRMGCVMVPERIAGNMEEGSR